VHGRALPTVFRQRPTAGGHPATGDRSSAPVLAAGFRPARLLADTCAENRSSARTLALLPPSTVENCANCRHLRRQPKSIAAAGPAAARAPSGPFRTAPPFLGSTRLSPLRVLHARRQMRILRQGRRIISLSSTSIGDRYSGRFPPHAAATGCLRLTGADKAEILRSRPFPPAALPSSGRPAPSLLSLFAALPTCHRSPWTL
jgi:hypothetical protein